MHQIALVTVVQSLTKSKLIEDMLGKAQFVRTRNVYDYLVTGTTGAAPFEVITEQEIKSVMERLEWIKNALRRGTGTILPTNKSLYDILWLDRFPDESGSFLWDTSAYTTVEQDISALFTTALTGTTRRKYAVYLDLTGPAGDAAAWTECTIRLKIKVDGSNYRTIDKKVIAKTDVAAAEEPGVPIDILAIAQDCQITMQFNVALAGDQTIYYHYVKEIME